MGDRIAKAFAQPDQMCVGLRSLCRLPWRVAL